MQEPMGCLDVPCRVVTAKRSAALASPPLPPAQADLNDPTSLPAALVGIHTIIDCSTARPEESTSKIDWEGKVCTALRC